MNQQELDIWLKGCLTYYNNHSLIKTNSMKTTEERIEQLEKAHSRLFNLVKDIQLDIHNMKDRAGNSYLEFWNKIEDIKNILQPKDDVQVLPDELKNGIEYKAIVSEIVRTKQVKWKGIDYTNWELKLEGKEEYVYLAFIPTENTVMVGDKVRFTYTHPFQLKKLKQLSNENN